WFRKLDSYCLTLAARPDGQSRYVAFLPLQMHLEMKKDGTFYSEMKMGGAEFADYSGLLCEPAYQDEAIRALGERVLQMRWMKLNFTNILASEKRFRAFVKPFERPKLDVEHFERFNKKTKLDSNIYPFVNLPSDWESYCTNQLSTNTRQKAK